MIVSYLTSSFEQSIRVYPQTPLVTFLKNTLNRLRGASALCGIFLIVMCSFSSIQANRVWVNGGPQGGMFSILSHNYQGDLLVIEYEIKYPGLTKVRMFDDADNLLWRSQYVDDKQGTHQVVLKADRMKPGNYRFEFEYKNQFESLLVSR